MKKEKELFTRYEGNPILTPEKWPYPVEKVFNPAAVNYDSKIVLLVRALDRTNSSHLSLAKSSSGKTDWEIDPEPTLVSDCSPGDFKPGLEDPRIVWIEEYKNFVISCVSFRNEYEDKPFGISLIGTKDFFNFWHISRPLSTENKNACVFPRKINGNFVLIHRPTISGRSYISVSFSPDLIFWGNDKPLFSTRRWCWDSEKIGLGSQPIETEKGWLLIYHGSWEVAHKLVYRVGLALLDLESLELIHRSEEWVFGPREDYEGGDEGIIFPCGAVIKENDLWLYYGAKDSSIGLTIANLDEILDYLMKCPEK